ncbi:MAG: hypothetical protein Q9221_008490 [Calogaya cf. arnoldii]
MLLRWLFPLLVSLPLVSLPSLVQAFPAISPRAPPSILENIQEEADVCSDIALCSEKGHKYWDELHTTLADPHSVDRADTTQQFNTYYAPELAGYIEIGVEDYEVASKMQERHMGTGDLDIWEVNSFDPITETRLRQTAFFNAFNTFSGIIYAKGNWRSSDANKKENQLQWSEIMYQTWKISASAAQEDRAPNGPISNLRAVVQKNAVNEGTKEIFRAAYESQNDPLVPGEDFEWRAWTEQSHPSFFLAMLGTDNVKGTIWLLKDHAVEIGRKDISAIHSLWSGDLDICFGAHGCKRLA